MDQRRAAGFRPAGEALDRPGTVPAFLGVQALVHVDGAVREHRGDQSGECRGRGGDGVGGTAPGLPPAAERASGTRPVREQYHRVCQELGGTASKGKAGEDLT